MRRNVTQEVKQPAVDNWSGGFLMPSDLKPRIRIAIEQALEPLRSYRYSPNSLIDRPLCLMIKRIVPDLRSRLCIGTVTRRFVS